MTFINLYWEEIEGHFGKSWIAEVPGFQVSYCIYIDRSSGETIGVGLDREKSVFGSIQHAKDHFRKDFQHKVNQLITTNHE